MINRPLFVSYGIYGAGSISLIFEAPESPIYLSIFSLAGECFWGVPKFVSQGAEVLKLRHILTKTEFQDFREQLYNEFEHRADSKMDLLDALCSNNHSPSVVQLSLNPLFRRGYSALFKAIEGNPSSPLSEEDTPQPEDIPLQQGDEFQFLDLIAQVVPSPKKRHFLLMGQDCTTLGRPFAKTLDDRGIVHQPTVIKGNKPITVGHSYSLIAVLPERNDEDATWSIPLDMSRV